MLHFILACTSWCRSVDTEATPLDPEPVPVIQKKAPIFAEAAQIQTVDTLEGLICTHEVCTTHLLYRDGVPCTIVTSGSVWI